jgi:hypothetical protein
MACHGLALRGAQTAKDEGLNGAHGAEVICSQIFVLHIDMVPFLKTAKQAQEAITPRLIKSASSSKFASSP